MRVLLADDDPITRIRLDAYLRSWGHEVLSANDGDEAWDLFQQGDPWLVISDWQMPGLNGVEFIRRIREHAKPGGYVYTILLTSRSEKTDLVEGMEAGADDFVSKPFDKDELRVRIRAGERVIRLERTLAERNRQLTAVNERMRQSLQAAARIQQAFLPKPAETFAGIQASWRYLPCDELAGDTLNILRLDPTHIGLYLADVSGHGVSASLLSVMLGRVLSQGIGSDGILVRSRADGDEPEIVAPGEVARHLNERFPWNPEAMEYFTLFYAVLDCRARELRYVCAGHPRPVLVPARRPVEHLRTDPPAVGLLPGSRYAEHSLGLVPGDRLYAFTDGLLEALSPAGEEFGEERLAATAEAARTKSLAASTQAMIDAVDSWRQGSDPTDDQCVVGIQIE
jgi:sigma-B regulation protein RsbU (phosphoserine phosphatase)